jgi:hypothetical protein
MPLGWIVGAAAALFGAGLLLFISDVRRTNRERARARRRRAAMKRAEANVALLADPTD